ncbi:PEP-CTERM motif protein [Posidoniimonas corsicana]|uniref:PEP-CTERM motif protein n=1 Tax=Posidoniimonas corsicana TaxID=1938618 RepID=A0A5C5VHJ7_9BACT|nr:PEP-CTERM sorting domain-containing protein [Posidoniimonas corsicana]TWT37420.1 PEP-CTERM motif protein [Posidoniimonas corsicana]
MTTRLAWRLAALLLIAGTAPADIIIVDEDFESYNNDSELWNVWAPIVAESDAGLLEDGTFIPNAFPEGGQGVDHIGGPVNEYVPALGNEGSGEAIVPSATQSIVLSGDIFDTEAAGNKRMTIGLRNSSVPSNIIELGLYNSFGVTEPNDVDSPSYGFRLVLFSGGSTGYLGGWVPILLDPSLDTAPEGEEPDGVVGPGDIGEAWHRYTATITPTDITVTMDLFRDGLNNATQEAGVDFTQTLDIVTSADGFDSLRIGGPSNSSSAGGGVVFDNISLTLVDVDAPSLIGDYNGDGTVDAADYTVWRDTLGDSVTAGEGADGNNNGVIDTGDYDEWVANYGATSAAPSAAAAAPEPATLGLLLAGSLALAASRRRFAGA